MLFLALNFQVIKLHKVRLLTQHTRPPLKCDPIFFRNVETFLGGIICTLLSLKVTFFSWKWYLDEKKIVLQSYFIHEWDEWKNPQQINFSIHFSCSVEENIFTPYIKEKQEILLEFFSTSCRKNIVILFWNLEKEM